MPTLHLQSNKKYPLYYILRTHSETRLAILRLKISKVATRQSFLILLSPVLTPPERSKSLCWFNQPDVVRSYYLGGKIHDQIISSVPRTNKDQTGRKSFRCCVEKGTRSREIGFREPDLTNEDSCSLLLPTRHDRWFSKLKTDQVRMTNRASGQKGLSQVSRVVRTLSSSSLPFSKSVVCPCFRLAGGIWVRLIVQTRFRIPIWWRVLGALWSVELGVEVG